MISRKATRKNLVVISAPSGSGKTTVCRGLQSLYPEWNFSLSLTTRPRRSYERDGYDYTFASEREFRQRVDRGEFVEYEEVHGHLYGTLRATVERALETGETLLLELDVKGGMAIKDAYPDNSVTVFIRPPSVEELRRRLRGRGSDTEAVIQTRLERMEMEMANEEFYDYSVINEKVETTIEEIVRILNSEQSEVEGARHGN
ncbi:MAG: guanylate kinase [Candidatus Neomarinimicrobiota bacterium]